jgi:hypothetical protein
MVLTAILDPCKKEPLGKLTVLPEGGGLKS